MVNARIATGAEMPINKHGGPAQYAGEEAELVGIDANGDVVKADADAATAVKARGVLFGPVTDLSTLTDGPEKRAIEANRTVLGDKISYVQYGVVIENSDEDWNFTPGDDVLLASGGGFTQTEPVASSGDLRQVVGYAIEDGNTVVLDISMDHTVA